MSEPSDLTELDDVYRSILGIEGTPTTADKQQLKLDLKAA
jgi:hypothetical protein